MFLHDWYRCVCPRIFWGNVLLSQSQKNVLMTFDVHCTSVPSGFCWCEYMCTDPEGGHQRGERNHLRTACCFAMQS